MKKSLIALAALAVVSAASAQSSVKISGLLDFAAVSNSKITTQTNTVKTNSTGALSAFSTSQLSFSGTEDLGGGLKASFVLNSAVTGTSSSTTGFGDRDKNLALAGGFGTVRVGRFVPAAAYGFYALSGTASSSVGSVYSIGQSKADGVARLGATSTGAGNFERNDNNVQYTSPKFNGLTLNVNYGSSSTDTSTFLAETKTSQTGLSVTYANGPLSIAAGINNRSVDEVSTSAATGDKINGDLNWVGASYDLGTAKLFVSHVMREDDTTVASTSAVTVNADIKVTSFGVSVPMGAFKFGASTYTGTNKVAAADATDDTKLSGYQLTAQYALSKRTSLYALMGTNKIARDSGNSSGNTFKESGTSFGLVHSF